MKKKILVGYIMGFISAIILRVSATVVYNSSNITYSNSKTKATNVEDALNELYDNESTCATTFKIFDFIGGEESFLIGKTGYYQLEAWGAQGGDSTTSSGGYGSYSTGFVLLNKNDVIYVNVGGKSTNGAGSYNGGSSSETTGYIYGGGGGGATHISKSSGLLSTLSADISSILMVAGGGGGAGSRSSAIVSNSPGGAGGGISGLRGISGIVSDTSWGYAATGGAGGSQTSSGGNTACGRWNGSSCNNLGNCGGNDGKAGGFGFGGAGGSGHQRVPDRLAAKRAGRRHRTGTVPVR